MSFAKLGLSSEILTQIQIQGYSQPTPIQMQVIPAILNGQDILATAETGSGKTASFCLPLLQLLSQNAHLFSARSIRALILTPTRELALQIHNDLQQYISMGMTSEVMIGGINIHSQFKKLHRGMDIVIATPGRLLELLMNANIELASVQYLIIDEADRMLDLGFSPAIYQIIQQLPLKRQTLLFSATFPPSIQSMAQKLLVHPLIVQLNQQQKTAKKVEQWIYPIKAEYKAELLTYWIQHYAWSQVLIFVRTKQNAERLMKKLTREHIRCATLHSDKNQNDRLTVLDWFKSGKIIALIATDIAARGLNIDQLPQVVNYDLPDIAEDYIHRIGRTGRAGYSGQAWSLVCPEQAKQLMAIEALLKYSIPRVADTGYETVSLNIKSIKSGHSVKKNPKVYSVNSNQRRFNSR